MLVPKSLQYLPTNLYTSVVDFIYFRRLVESQLNSQILTPGALAGHRVHWQDTRYIGRTKYYI